MLVQPASFLAPFKQRPHYIAIKKTPHYASFIMPAPEMQ